MRRLESRMFDDRGKGLDRFGALAVVSIAAIVAGSLVDLRLQDAGVVRRGVVVLATVLIAAMLALALRASGVARRPRLVIEIVLTAGVGLTAFLVMVDGLTERSLLGASEARPSWLWVAMAVAVPLTITRRLLRHDHVSLGTLMGAVCVYLSLTVAFFLLFFAIDAAGPQLLPEAGGSTTRFMDLSMQSITTLGSGDLIPTTDLGRLLKNGEAMIGQLFLVSFFAMFVSLFVGSRGDRGTGPGSPPAR